MKGRPEFGVDRSIQKSNKTHNVFQTLQAAHYEVILLHNSVKEIVLLFITSFLVIFNVHYTYDF